MLGFISSLLGIRRKSGTRLKYFRILDLESWDLVNFLCNFGFSLLLPPSKDITDLFGADLPVEGGKGGEFAWRDGPLLAALKAGHWVVLDEVRRLSLMPRMIISSVKSSCTFLSSRSFLSG